MKTLRWASRRASDALHQAHGTMQGRRGLEISDETVLKQSRNQIALNPPKSRLDQTSDTGDEDDQSWFKRRSCVAAGVVWRAQPASAGAESTGAEAQQVTLLVGPLLFVLLGVGAVSAKKAGRSGGEIALLVAIGSLVILVVMLGVLMWGSRSFA